MRDRKLVTRKPWQVGVGSKNQTEIKKNRTKLRKPNQIKLKLVV